MTLSVSLRSSDRLYNFQSTESRSLSVTSFQSPWRTAEWSRCCQNSVRFSGRSTGPFQGQGVLHRSGEQQSGSASERNRGLACSVGRAPRKATISPLDLGRPTRAVTLSPRAKFSCGGRREASYISREICFRRPRPRSRRLLFFAGFRFGADGRPR